MLKQCWKAMRRIDVLGAPKGTPESEGRRPGGGKLTWLGAWGETLEGGTGESQLATLEDHRLTRYEDCQDSQDSGIDTRDS